jgi:hypothetical protein
MSDSNSNEGILGLLPENYERLDSVTMGAAPLSACEGGTYVSNCKTGGNYDKCVNGGSGTCPS